jgi:hypothetical protein
VTGELEIASREDFREFERTYRDLRRERSAAPIYAAALLLAAGAVGWRWADVYGLLATQAPSLAARLPDSLRPGARFDGEEHEPNLDAARANALPIPPGPDGEPAGGTVTVRGTLGARVDDQTGDVDVFRIELPPLPGPRVLSARWHADGSEAGIRGLDVALALNRAPPPASEDASAPLVASSNRGGPGSAEALEAPVMAGTWYLSIRERHDASEGPVEKPTDRYALDVRLREVEPGEEVEPNDSPETIGHPAARYADWRAMGERNPLAEATSLRGEILPGDADTFALRVEGRAAVVVVTPSAQLTPALEVWTPAPADLDAAAPERGRLDPAGEAEAGAPLVVQVSLSEIGPALIRLRGGESQGAYSVVVLGGGKSSVDWALDEIQRLAANGKLPPALELAAAYVRALGPDASVAKLARGLAEEAATQLTPADLPQFAKAERTLGRPVFESKGGSIRYADAFFIDPKR